MGTLRIADRSPDACRVAVGTAQRLMLRRHIAHLRLGLGPHLRPQLRIMPTPTDEAEILAAQSRGAGRCDQRGFDHEGAGAAHRVKEARALGGEYWPTGTQQDPRRHVLLQRRLARLTAIAATVQALTGKVDRHCHLLAVGVGMNPYVGALTLDIRPEAGPGAQSIADCILQLQGTKVRVGDLRMLAAEVAGESRLRPHMSGPVDAPDLGVELLGGRRIESGDLQEHPVGRARAQTDAVRAFQRSLEAHARAAFANGARAAGAEFLRQQVGQATWAAGDQRQRRALLGGFAHRQSLGGVTQLTISHTSRPTLRKRCGS